MLCESQFSDTRIADALLRVTRERSRRFDIKATRLLEAVADVLKRVPHNPRFGTLAAQRQACEDITQAVHRAKEWNAVRERLEAGFRQMPNIAA